MPVRIYHNPRCNTSRKTLALLRDKVLKPLLAASCHPMLSSERDKSVPLDQHYDVRCGMRGIFDALGIAA